MPLRRNGEKDNHQKFDVWEDRKYFYLTTFETLWLRKRTCLGDGSNFVSLAIGVAGLCDCVLKPAVGGVDVNLLPITS
jgi:hypothetical protein